MMRLIAFACMIAFTPASLAQQPGESFQPGGATSPDGQAKVVTDLPSELRLHNTGGLGPRGPGSGAGLCVFTSIEHAGRYANERPVFGLQKYMTRREGGGYPEKVDKVLATFAPGVSYVQHIGGDESFLRLALKTGRMVCVTYDGQDDFYHGKIAHMVNLVYLDDSRAAILDNNREKVYLWMTRQEFLQRWRGNSGGWAVVLLHCPPPPPFPGR